MHLFYPSDNPHRYDDETKLCETFGRNVKTLRTQQQLKKKTFANMCGFGRPLLDLIESGQSDIRLSYIEVIADALSVSPSALLAARPSGDAASPVENDALQTRECEPAAHETN